MKLRAIPPANRRSGAHLSSMRATTHTGFTFVGGQTRPPIGQPTTPFQPRVVRPDSQIQAQRAAYHQALQALVEQLEALLVAAEPEEARFWRQQLDRLRDRLSPGG